MIRHLLAKALTLAADALDPHPPPSLPSVATFADAIYEAGQAIGRVTERRLILQADPETTAEDWELMDPLIDQAQAAAKHLEEVTS